MKETYTHSRNGGNLMIHFMFRQTRQSLLNSQPRLVVVAYSGVKDFSFPSL
jgi:hypothetical protein